MKSIEQLQREIKEAKAAIRRLKGQTKTGGTDPKLIYDKDELQAKVLELPNLPKSLQLLLDEEGFITGSVAYGYGREAKDIDYCIMVPPHVFEGYALGSDQNYWIEDGFCSVYAHEGGLMINILCFSDVHLYDAWYMATQYMQQINLLNVTTYGSKKPTEAIRGLLADDKWSRVRLFRALKEILTPVKIKENPMSKEDALRYHRCTSCHGEAINFTCRSARETWRSTGLCERCQKLSL